MAASEASKRYKQKYLSSAKGVATLKAYNARPEVIARQRAAERKYAKSPKGVATRRKNRARPERVAAQHEWNVSVAGRAALKRWYLGEKGRAWFADPAQKIEKYARNAARRATKRKAKCACCEPKEFTAAYANARNQGLEVDHILALALGGKHCCKNLQLLTKDQHKIKTREDVRAFMKKQEK